MDQEGLINPIWHQFLSDLADRSSTDLTVSYTVTNGATDRAYDADATTTEELADVLGTLIADLVTEEILP